MKKVRFTTSQIILFSFLAAILLGSFLLALPVSWAEGQTVPYLDALFTATTSVCVTGLVTLPVAATWSLFGQAVILVLIQVGGLGVITVMSGLMLLLNRKFGIDDRLLIQDAFNLNTMAGLTKFIKQVLLGTLIVEGAGAALYMFVFVPQFGLKGIWISVFTAVSAFCNAGIDVIGESSLCGYAANPVINLVTAALIILGGLGYIVWWDVLRVLKTRTKNNRKVFRYLTLHSKIAITVTVGLIFAGMVLFLALEHSNPMTLGKMPLDEKLQAAFFQSVTTRTAGFASIPQENLTDAAALVSVLLMMIGGSPVGTAGGMKTVTMAVLVCSAAATVKNQNDAELFGRRISNDSVRKAVAVAVMFLGICFASTVLLMAVSDAPALDVIYETVSATATVGLSRSLTAGLNTAGKWIIIATMYLGRVGPISLAVALGSSQGRNIIAAPTEEISIG